MSTTPSGMLVVSRVGWLQADGTASASFSGLVTSGHGRQLLE